jgi:hypothetical protein
MPIKLRTEQQSWPTLFADRPSRLSREVRDQTNSRS